MHDPLIEWLYQLQGPSLKWDLDTTLAFASLLGQPQRRLRCVHIAGTNGKGSVAAMVHAIARGAGLSVGLNTSPHLVRPEERIRIDDADIDAGRFRALIAELRLAAEQGSASLPRHPSFFEMLTLAALRAFERRGVDLAVIETGLGGRLDATNLVVPLVSVITTIGLDHVVALGGSRSSIAREKAGVIKPGVPILAGWIDPDALAVIESRAQRVGAPFHPASRELTIEPLRSGRFHLTTPLATYRDIEPPLAGAHQRQNAALAIRAAELLRQRGVDIPERGVVAGLARTRWPGRMEQIAGSPSWLLDGAHNADGADALGAALRERYRLDPRRRALVFGLTEGRDPERLIAPLAASVERVIVTQPSIAKAQPAESIAERLRAAVRLPVEAIPSLPAALRRASESVGSDGEVIVAGSLYLVGDARSKLLGLEGPGHPAREIVPPIDQPAAHRPIDSSLPH